MPDIGFRELKVRASEFVRSVREFQAKYVVIHRGRAETDKFGGSYWKGLGI